LNLTFQAEIWEWRGPAPYFFLTVPSEQSSEIREAAKVVSYGWGMIPVVANIRGIEFRTSMFAKDGNYVLPIKNAVRLPLKIEVGDLLEVSLELGK
jgi:hypothetical protein